MSEADSVTIKVNGQRKAQSLPPLFASASRSVGAPGEEFLPPGYLQPTATFDVGGAARSVGPAVAETHDAEAEELVVLVLEDGSTLVTSAAKLHEAVERSHPDWLDEDGAIPFEKLRAAGAAPSRGFAEAVGVLVTKA